MTKIKTELLKLYISDYIKNNITDFEIDANEIANTTAIKILAEIQKILGISPILCKLQNDNII